MILENTENNKLKLFAMYHGQFVLRVREYGRKWVNSYRVQYLDTELPGHFLELKTFVFISDDDAKTICSAIGMPMATQSYIGREFITYVDDSYTIRFYYSGFVSVFRNKKHMLFDESKHAMDVAISLGYAFPFMGVSIDEQVKRNWITLKERV